MRRLLFALLGLVSATPASAQIGVTPGSLAPPVIVFPASAVNGAGVTNVPVLFPDGSASAPSEAFASQPTLGTFKSGTDRLAFSGNYSSTVPSFVFYSGGTPNFQMANVTNLSWSTTSDAGGAAGTILTAPSAGKLSLTNGTAANTTEMAVSGGNGGSVSIVKALTELTTIAAAATTSTAIQIPANAVVLAVSVRVVTVIPTAATFTVTSATPAKTWNTVAVSTAANTTDVGTAPGPSFQTTASPITITPNLTPGAATGQVRVTIYYYQVTPPTS